MINIQETFDKHEAAYLNFDRVENKLASRKDLHAMMLLDKLVPDTSGLGANMVSAAEHDEIWLHVEPADLAKVATEEQIFELVCCGVRYDEDTESLALFV